MVFGFGLSFNSTTLTKFIFYGTIHSALNFIIVYGLVKYVLSKKEQKFLLSLMFGLVGLGALAITYSHLFIFPYLLGSNGAAKADHFRTNTITKECNFGGAVDGQTFQDPWYYKIGCTQGQAEALSNAGLNVQVFTVACETACRDSNTDDYCPTSNSKNSDAQFCTVLVDCPAIECPKFSGGIL